MIYKKFLIFPPIILGVVVLVYMAGSKKAPVQKPPEERIRHVRVIEAAKTDFQPRTIGFGSVKPGRVWNAVSQVSGQIEYVHPDFKKGAILTAGTEIIRIADTDYKIAIKQAEANIRSAEAQLRELTVTEENNRSALKIEEKSLAIKKQGLDRKLALLKKGTISQASVDQEQRDFLNQEKRVLDLKNSLKLLPTKREVQKEQLAVFRTQLETAKLNLERTKITIPFSGRISEVKVEVTQFAGVGALLGSVDGIEVAEIAAQIPLSNVRRLLEAFAAKGDPTSDQIPRSFDEIIGKYGLHALVRLHTGDSTFLWKGEVSRSSDTVDPKTRAAGVIVSVKDNYKLAVPAKRPPLVKGMFVEVELRSRVAKDKILVPRSAVHNRAKGYVLYVIDEDSRLVIRPIKIAHYQGNLAIIQSGLKAGEKVVVTDLSPAIAKMKLQYTLDKALMVRVRNEAQAKGEQR